jgi:hypothetical protein
VRAQAKIMAEAVIKHDYKTLFKYLALEGFPKGKLNIMTTANAMKTVQAADTQMIKQGISIQSITFGDVLSILKVGFEMQCTLVQIKEMKMQFGKAITKSTLVAISDDNGINWKFIDAIGRDKNEMRRLVPKLSDKLIFATPENPKFINDVKTVK